MLKSTDADVPPLWTGFTTVIDDVPILATSAELISAVISVEETNVVVRREPFQSTTDAFTKFVPSTVRVNPRSPTVVDAGEREVITGAEPGIIVNIAPVEVPPPGAGFVTVIVEVPRFVISAESIAAVT